MAGARRPQSLEHAALVRLARLLSSDRTLAREVMSAMADPETYLRENESSLRKRGIGSDSQVDGLPWLALVHGLVERRRAVEIDWRSEPDELRRAFEDARPRPTAAAWRDIWSRVSDAPMDEVLAELAKRLSQTAHALCELVRPADTYAVLLVRRKTLDEAVRFASEAGHILREFERRPARAPKPGKPKKERRPSSWKQYLHSEGVTNTNGLLYKLVRDSDARQRAEMFIDKAPKRERATISSLLEILGSNGELLLAPTVHTAPLLEALTYLWIDAGAAKVALRTLVRIIHECGLTKPNAAQAKKIVRVLQFPRSTDVGRTAFTELDDKDRLLLRRIVEEQIRSGKIDTATPDAAKVVGDSTLAPALEAMAPKSSALIKPKLMDAATFLKRQQ